jgi:hypothetical protein
MEAEKGKMEKSGLGAASAWGDAANAQQLTFNAQRLTQRGKNLCLRQT